MCSTGRGTRSLCLFSVGLGIAGILLTATAGHAGILDASWIAPTTNVDGSALTDLASYRIYYGTSPAPCPGPSFFETASSTPSPPPAFPVAYTLTGLATGTLYFVSVTAVNTSGGESTCFTPAQSATARIDFTVTPTGTVNFGNVTLGLFADQTFTVQNTGGGTISGTVTTAAPFSVVSGSTFTLGLGQTQIVTVRFTPTTPATATGSVNFSANSGSISRVVTGTGVPDTVPPTITITTPTTAPTYSTSSSPLTLGGTASDNVGVTQVTWANSRGGSGTATGTTTWTASGIVLQPGTNVLTATARDAAGNTGTATLTVTYTTGGPTVTITAPTAGQTVSNTISVTATATDPVGVVGVQFKLDGANLGAEVMAAPYAVSWDTTTTANGNHTLTAVARNAAGLSTTSAAVSVTVSNAGPVISGVTASGISSSGATISWLTDTPSDSQVEYGLTSGYGLATVLAPTLVTSHGQTLSTLTANTLYHFRVKSRNSAGTLATSGDFTFMTLPSINTGLVAYWTFDEGSGTTAADSSGNGNTGTLVNGPTWTTGKINGALAFDGLASYVNVPHASMLNAYPLTIAAWINTNATTGSGGIVNKYFGGSSNGYQVFLNNGNLCAWYIRTATNGVYDGTACPLRTSGYADGQWHWVVFVVDGSGGRLYVDGAQKASLAWTGTTGAPTTIQPVQTGASPGPTASYFAGIIDDVRIYNRALSFAEIAAYWGSVGGGTGNPPVITAITAAAYSSSAATISWATDKGSDTQVDYGLTPAYGSSTPLDIALVVSHSKTVTGLAPKTVYHFRVKSRDVAGNLAVSADATFVMPDPPGHKKHRKDWLDAFLDYVRHITGIR